MPVTPTYPGVYIEEIPSGVRTIQGVATSIAAFIGWAPKGDTEKAGLVLSWMDYDREYGGLDPDSQMSFSVYHFFANGGQQAYIIRLVSTDAASATANLGELIFTTRNPGEWGNKYAIGIKNRTDLTDEKRFQLKVNQIVNGEEKPLVIETFDNLSMDPKDRRFVEAIINQQSLIIKAKVADGATEPPTNTEEGHPSPLEGGENGAILQPNTSDFETALDKQVELLRRVDIFNLLCVPGETIADKLSKLEKFCHDQRAFLIADCPQESNFDLQKEGPTGLTGNYAKNAAYYFPWVKAPNPLQDGTPTLYPPCGFVAGIYARTDSSRGVWKAPAGIETSLTGVIGLNQNLTNDENGVLNPQAINCLRTFRTYGTVIWGARTLHGNDERGSEWKYISVRRTALFIEESLYRGTQWVVFEPNDEPLWSQIRLDVGAFMHTLFRQGAFQGQKPKDAYFVKCNKETTTQNDIDRGIVNIVVGFAPLKPAEFVIIKIQQIAGQIEA